MFILAVFDLLIPKFDFNGFKPCNTNDANVMLANVTHNKVDCALSEGLILVLKLVSDIGLLRTNTATIEFCMAYAPC